MVHSLLHYYLCFPAHIGTGFQIQAVPIAQVNATVQTAATHPAGKLNNMTMNGKLLALFFILFLTFSLLYLSPSNEAPFCDYFLLRYDYASFNYQFPSNNTKEKICSVQQFRISNWPTNRWRLWSSNIPR